MTTHPAWDDQPFWSPDGSEIGFVTQRDGNRDIAMVPAEGGEVRYLTRSPLDERGAQWTPDGTTLVYYASSPDAVLVTVDVTDLVGATD